MFAYVFETTPYNISDVTELRETRVNTMLIKTLILINYIYIYYTRVYTDIILSILTFHTQLVYCTSYDYKTNLLKCRTHSI